jgi:predicted TIM-barrel fold metal-dependent hydrolase
MVSRREMLFMLGATGVAAWHQRATALSSLDLRMRATSADFPMPAGACDCHVHVFGDARRFPLSPERAYTPPPAPVDEVRRLLRGLHMDRVVIVSASVYGTNNDCALDAIRQLGSRARGVANVSPEAADSELERLRRGGIRGLRLNFETQGVFDPRVVIERFHHVSARAAAMGWHLQVNTRLSIVEAMEEHVLAGPATVVFDHFAQAEAALGVDQPGFSSLLRLLKSGRAYVKISAGYRISTRPPDYPDVLPLAQALIAANPERVLWGSDWPHPDSARRLGRSPTDVAPPLPVDDRHMLNQFAVWAPDPAVRRTILVENPARLYGFRA